MDIEVGYLLTLDNDVEYLVVAKTKIKEKEYLYLINNELNEVKFCYIDKDEVVEIDDIDELDMVMSLMCTDYLKKQKEDKYVQ